MLTVYWFLHVELARVVSRVFLQVMGFSMLLICFVCNFFSFCRAEKCLLYSMRLWGHNTNSFHVASGTIYNEVKLFCMIVAYVDQKEQISVDYSCFFVLLL